MLRYLRLAVIAACLGACICLLIVWGRSGRSVDFLMVKHPAIGAINVFSLPGRAMVTGDWTARADVSGEFGSRPVDDDSPVLRLSMTYEFCGFGYTPGRAKQLPATGNVAMLVIPLWAPTFVMGLAAATLWLAGSSRRADFRRFLSEVRLRMTLKRLFALFSAAILAFAWIGWQGRIVGQRQALLRFIDSPSETIYMHGLACQGDSREWIAEPYPNTDSTEVKIFRPLSDSPPSAIRRWFGDSRYAVIAIREESMWPGAREIFPEATFVVMNGDGVRVKGPKSERMISGPRQRLR